MRVLVSLSKGRMVSHLVVLLFLLAAALGALSWTTTVAKIKPLADDSFVTLGHSLHNRQSIIAGESITVTPRGFEPVEIARPHGRFVLNINNRSGIHELSFLLTDETGNRLRTVQFSRGKPSSRELLNLSPGRYRLSEISHNTWVCQIVISAR